ncbi:MAG: flagellar hook-length control protein FliK [Rhodoferax sp.]
MTIEAGNASQTVRHSRHAESGKHSKTQQSVGDAGGGVDFMTLLAGLGEEDGTSTAEAQGVLNLGGSDSMAVNPLFNAGVEIGVASEASSGNLVNSVSSEPPPLVQDVARLRSATVGATDSVTERARVSILTDSLEQGESPASMVDGAGSVNEIMLALEGARIQPGDQVLGAPKAVKQLSPGMTEPLMTKDQNFVVDRDAKRSLIGIEAKVSRPSPLDDTAAYAKGVLSANEASKANGDAETRLAARFLRNSEMQPNIQSPSPSLALEPFGSLREIAKVHHSEKRTNTEVLSASSLASPESVGVSAAEAAVPVDVAVAEKVAFWLTNDVQNAELKLDGLGEQPVEVSIRLQGNEAHVAFRTDEAQARNALEQAGTALRDLLHREGLMLTGVSVGTTGTGDGQREPTRDGRTTGRKGSAEVVVGIEADRIRPPGVSVGRSVDLFV